MSFTRSKVWFCRRSNLIDKNSVQQGYITSEPFAIQKQGGFQPVVFLLADYGYQPYATILCLKKKIYP